MRHGLVAFVVLTLVGLALTGCGLFRFEQREPWRSQAEEACLSQQMVQPTAYMSRASKIDGPGACGMDYPFKVSAFAGGSVGLTSKATLACPIIPRIDTWLDEVVKPAALLYYGVPVVDVKAGSYSCRPRNNQSGAKASEHAFGNAMDVMGFVLGDGRQVMVVKGWRDPADQDFLREVFIGACRYFSTVLGPGADAFHYDHIHIDLARHDPRGERRICKPILKFTPRIDPEQAAAQVAMSKGSQADLPPLDIEEDLGAEDEPTPSLQTTSRQPLAPSLPHPPRPPVYSAGPPPSPLAPVYPVGPTRPPVVATQPLPSMRPSPSRSTARPLPTLAGDAYREPVYNRPAGQPQVLNGHGLY
jgi:hypothetical protein